MSGNANLRRRGQRVVCAAEPSGTQSGSARHADDKGDEWFRQGSGTARVSLRAGSHHELGIAVLGACASSNERGASSLGFAEVEASVVACEEPGGLAASPQW